MFKSDYNKLIKAAEVVCINCIICEQDVCNNCPVRKTIEYHNSNL